MTVTVTMIERRSAGGGSFYESGTSYSMDDAQAAQYVQKGWATYVTRPAGEPIPAQLATDANGNATGLVGLSGVIENSQSLPTNADVVVYGASFDGCVAAIAAARAGCNVVVVEPGTDVGGMPVSGLGLQDWKGSSYAGMAPIVAEIFKGASLRYGLSPAATNITQWKITGKPFYDQIISMLNAAGVRLFTGWRPKESGAVQKAGAYTKSVIFQRTENAGAQSTIAANQWIDAHHNPDVARQAGITFVTGREANAEFTETSNGVRTTSTTWAFSGYKIAGDTGSGLLPNIDPVYPLETSGSADTRVMPPCVRMILTQTGGIPIPEPDMAFYNPERYEFLRRVLASGYFTKLQKLTSEGGNAIFIAYDLADGHRAFNNAQIGLNAIGLHQTYATTYDYATRDQLDYLLRQYHLGLFYFLRTSPDVPSTIKDELATWKLVDGERYAADGLPFLTYHRETLRMRGEYVLQQTDIVGTRFAVDPVTYGVYNADVQNVTLRASAASQVIAEGDISTVTTPTYYGIDRRITLPKRSESANIQVSHCASATHVGWASLRVDPVLGGLGETCGIRAAMAVKAGVSVHEVTGETLRPLLQYEVAPSTVMEISGTADVTGGTTQTVTGGTIEFVGTWVYRAGFGFGLLAAKAWDDNGTSKGSKTIKFVPTVIAARYAVKLYIPPISGASPDATIEIKHARGTDTIVVDLGGGGDWMFRKLGEYLFVGDGSDYIKLINTGTGYCRIRGLAVQAV